MTRTELKKKYLAAAVITCGIVTGIVFYTVVVELLRRMGYKPPVEPPAAYAVKYAFYFMGASALALLKLAGRYALVKKADTGETAALLVKLAIVRAGICELPAICGLIMFLLTGYYADFYLLVLFSIALEIYNFPRLAQWEERLRGDFGGLPE